MDVTGLPAAQHEMVICGVAAAVEYQVPANMLLAVAEQEAGQPKTWSRNSNGSFDVGVMQFNTAYLRHLQSYGITPEDVEGRGCYPFRLAAWRLAKHIKFDRGPFWQRVANYHSRTPKYNQKYQELIMPRAYKWLKWLEPRVQTEVVAENTR